MSSVLTVGATYYAEFKLVDPAAGVNQGMPINADAMPAIEIRKNGVVLTAGLPAVMLTNPLLGNYAVLFVVPAGWLPGDNIEIYITAVIGGITFRHAIAGFLVVGGPWGSYPPQIVTSTQVANRGNPDHFGGAQVKLKRPTIQMRAGFMADVQHTLLQDGLPFNYEDYGLGCSSDSEDLATLPQVRAKITERRNCNGVDIFVDLLDASRSVVRFSVPDAISCSGGLWLIEFYLLTSVGAKVFISDAYLYIEQAGGSKLGPPTIMEIRLFLRDFAQENELLDVIDFDGSEIATAADLCVCEWNEAPPPDGPMYSTGNFPYRRNWLVGISSYLFGIASEHYARNSLAYSAGGVSSDDKDKAMVYARKSVEAKQEWQAFVRERRMIESINSGGFREIVGVMGGWY
jgi:hypothetical protein